jgi:hypothetical protein
MTHKPNADLPSVIRVQCARCKLETVHDVLAGDSSDTYGRELGREDNEWVMTILRLVCTCQGCGNNCFVLHEDHSTEGESTAVYPPIPVRRVPAWYPVALIHASWDVLGLLGEIYAALQVGALRLTAAGIRTAFEQVFVDTVGDHGTFAKNLAEFQSKGYLSAKQRASIERVIEVGHAAVHRSHIPTIGDVTSMLDILEHTLQAIYVNTVAAENLTAIPPRSQRSRPAGGGHGAV